MKGEQQDHQREAVRRDDGWKGERRECQFGLGWRAGGCSHARLGTTRVITGENRLQCDQEQDGAGREKERSARDAPGLERFRAERRRNKESNCCKENGFKRETALGSGSISTSS
jgi:hypothetical protein